MGWTDICWRLGAGDSADLGEGPPGSDSVNAAPVDLQLAGGVRSGFGQGCGPGPLWPCCPIPEARPYGDGENNDATSASLPGQVIRSLPVEVVLSVSRACECPGVSCSAELAPPRCFTGILTLMSGRILVHNPVQVSALYPIQNSFTFKINN